MELHVLIICAGNHEVISVLSSQAKVQEALLDWVDVNWDESLNHLKLDTLTNDAFIEAYFEAKAPIMSFAIETCTLDSF